MTAPSHRRAAQDAPDKWARIGLMRDVMLEREHVTGSCTFDDLRMKGLSSAEIAAYRDTALELITKRPYALGTAPEGRMAGVALVLRAREIQRRLRRSTWSAPIVEPLEWAAPQFQQVPESVSGEAGGAR